jgi:UDP-N-acetylglucosamine diphosphorylase / glucose-1-phosphate thymidylyltransferase / UDP-N-acetylgalactosamine diphosphorylase / glucosamine-1-phosphate N-acetyltransferase / galactosamine-1-phosphate N-acetyltransferase
MCTCVILAAGEGKRMHPLTYTRPKVMLPIGNKPILEWNLINAVNAGITEFIFIIGYKSEMVRNYFQDGSKWDVSIEYVNQGKPKGTGHAISVVEPFIKEDFLILSGDTFFGTNDIQQIYKKSMSMGLCTVDNPEEYGIVTIKNGAIVHINEKMKNPSSNLINAGIYHFQHSMFDFLKKISLSQRGEYELTDAINLAAKKNLIAAVPIKQWRDIGYPWDLLDANKEILQKIQPSRNGSIEKYTTIEGPVAIGKRSRILNGSYIEGPVSIGEDCKIGPNCYIRPFTSIGNGCHIGAASEIKNSVIMDNTNIPHHNYVGDSIIGQNCNLGSGTKIANLRLDKQSIIVTHRRKKIDTKRRKLGVIMGDNVQTGINASLNVGCIIGNDVFIGPGTVADGSIHPKSHIL